MVYVHGLDVIVPNWMYQQLWLPFIRRCDLIIANSSNTAKLAAERGVTADKLRILNPGTELFQHDHTAGQVFRRRFELGGRPILLSVGRLTNRKGLAEFVAKAMPRILSANPHALLVIVGGEASDALYTNHASGRERIIDAARRVGVESALQFLGPCDDQTLNAAYQAATVHVFPVLEVLGDVEGFGMVALEAAAHGVPTVAFNVGGISDAVQQGHTGTLVTSGDYEAFAMATLDLLSCTPDSEYVESCREFAASKSWPVFMQRLRQYLEELLGGG